MKKQIIAYSLLLLTLPLHAQKAGDDKETKSSIILPVGSFVFSTKDTRIGLDYTYGTPFAVSTRYANIDTIRKAKEIPEIKFWFVNVQGSTSNSAGTGNLFSEGHYVPATDLSLVVGQKLFRPAAVKSFDSCRIMRLDIQKRYAITANNKALNKYEISNLSDQVKDTLLRGYLKELAKEEQDTIARTWVGKINRSIDSLNQLPENKPENVANRQIITERLNIYIHRLNENRRLSDLNRKNYSNKPKLYHSIHHNSFLLYAGAERTSRTFYLFNPDGISFNERYNKRQVAGGSVFAGINYSRIINCEPNKTNQCLIAGVRIGRELADNYASLSTFEVESSTIFTDSNRTDKQTKKIQVTDQLKMYHNFYQYRSYIDAMYFRQLDSAFVGIGAYARYNIVEKNDWNNKNNWSWGINTSFFNQKGVFSGGIFAELPGPKATTDNRYWYNRVTVGITTTFNFKNFDFAKLFAE